MSLNEISKVHISGKQLWFQKIDNPAIYKSDVSILSKDKLFSLLEKKKNLTFDCDAPRTGE